MKIMNTLCPGCKNGFYNATSIERITCPFCGFSFRVNEALRRGGRRVEFNNDCYILKDDVKIFVKAENISEKGLGIKIMGSIPFIEGDILQIVVRDFQISSRARVVWINRCNGIISRAGLQFC